MKSYILTAFMASVVIIFIRYLGDEKSATFGYLRLITSLVTVLILLDPFLSLMRNVTESIRLPETGNESVFFESGEKTAVLMAEKRLAEKINRMLYEKFGKIADGINVVLRYDEKQALFLIQKIEVTLSGEEWKDEVQGYLYDEFKTEITVRCGEEYGS